MNRPNPHLWGRKNASKVHDPPHASRLVDSSSVPHSDRAAQSSETSPASHFDTWPAFPLDTAAQAVDTLPAFPLDSWQAMSFPMEASRFHSSTRYNTDESTVSVSSRRSSFKDSAFDLRQTKNYPIEWQIDNNQSFHQLNFDNSWGQNGIQSQNVTTQSSDAHHRKIHQSQSKKVLRGYFQSVRSQESKAANFLNKKHLRGKLEEDRQHLLISGERIGRAFENNSKSSRGKQKKRGFFSDLKRSVKKLFSRKEKIDEYSRLEDRNEYNLLLITDK